MVKIMLLFVIVVCIGSGAFVLIMAIDLLRSDIQQLRYELGRLEDHRESWCKAPRFLREEFRASTWSSFWYGLKTGTIQLFLVALLLGLASAFLIGSY